MLDGQETETFPSTEYSIKVMHVKTSPLYPLSRHLQVTASFFILSLVWFILIQYKATHNKSSRYVMFSGIS